MSNDISHLFIFWTAMCLGSTFNLFSQTPKSQKNTDQFYNRLAETYMDSLPAQALIYAEKAYEAAKSQQNQQGIYRSLSNIVVAHWKLNNREAHKYYSKLLFEAFRQLEQRQQSTPWDKIMELQREADLAQLQLQKERYEKTINATEYENFILLISLVFTTTMIASVLIFLWKTKLTNALLRQQKQAIILQNNQLKAQNEQLRLMEKERNEFIHMLSHDLRTPFSAIHGLLRLIETDGPINPQQKAYIEQIDITIERANQLIKEVLEISMAEQSAHSSSATGEIVAARQLLGQVVNEFRPQAERKNIQIIFDDRALEVYALANRQALTRVLENLLSNAIKYSPTGRHIIVETGLKDAQCFFSIQDFGPGFTEDDKKKMFGKFQRLSAQPTGGESSTGLGLSIVKKLTEQMNGSIRCESEYGKGAKFTIMLPVAWDKPTIVANT
ncbi:sensor histidine kinase [Rhodoflexus sp.]